MRKPRELRIAAISVVTLQHAIGGGMERYFDHVTQGLGTLARIMHKSLKKGPI